MNENQAIINIARRDWKNFVSIVEGCVRGVVFGLFYSLGITALVMRLVKRHKEEQTSRNLAFMVSSIVGVTIGVELVTVVPFVLGKVKLGLVMCLGLCLFNAVNYLYNLPKRV
ncbi:hypothetical protein ACFLY5_00730 [Patescibacteria group bacterium]